MSKVSVIIPAYNEEDYIGKAIESLLSQSYKELQIIVVDDGSRDKTRQIVKRYKKVNLINGEHKGPGFSRNLGAKKAKGDILVFVDADMTFDKDYIKNLVSPIERNKEVIGTTHDYEVAVNTDNRWARLWGKVRVSKAEAKSLKIFRAIRRKVFLKLGGFDPKFGYADDQSLWIKHKISPKVANNTICYHRNPQTLKEVYKQSRWIGASIDNSLVQTKGLNYLIPIILYLISPVMIPLLSLNKARKNKDYKFFFPWMFIFMTSRYFGTIAGLINKIYFNQNIR